MADSRAAGGSPVRARRSHAGVREQRPDKAATGSPYWGTYTIAWTSDATIVLVCAHGYRFANWDGNPCPLCDPAHLTVYYAVTDPDPQRPAPSSQPRDPEPLAEPGA